MSALTHKRLGTYGCILSIVATDALVLKLQVISIESTDWYLYYSSHKLTRLFKDKQTTAVQYMWCIHPIPYPFPCPRLLPSAPYHVTKVCMFVVVNFDVLAQASDFRTERRQVVFLCWMPDSNQGLWNRISSRPNARWQTDWAIDNQAKKINSIARPYVDPLPPVSAQRPISCNKNMDVVTQHKIDGIWLTFHKSGFLPSFLMMAFHWVGPCTDTVRSALCMTIQTYALTRYADVSWWGPQNMTLLFNHPCLPIIWGISYNDSSHTPTMSINAERRIFSTIYRWLSARLQHLQCVSNGDTAALH